MVAHLEPVIDGLKFARDGRSIKGSVPLAALERLASMLEDVQGALSWQLTGERDRSGSYLLLSASCTLVMECQRCLTPVQQSFSLNTRLRLIPPGAEWPEDELEDDTSDAIEAGDEMAVLPLLEDEVLLALPIAPMHEVCEPPVAQDKNPKPSPFAVLAKLKP